MSAILLFVWVHVSQDKLVFLFSLSDLYLAIANPMILLANPGPLLKPTTLSKMFTYFQKLLYQMPI